MRVVCGAVGHGCQSALFSAENVVGDRDCVEACLRVLCCAGIADGESLDWDLGEQGSGKGTSGVCQVY